MRRDTESVALLTISDRAEVWGEIMSCAGSSRGVRLLGLLPQAAMVRKIEVSDADVVILDSSPNESEAIERLRCLTTELPAVRFVLIADNLERRFVFEAIKLGVRGIFVRPIIEGALVPALAVVARGGFSLCPKAAQVLFSSRPERHLLLLPEHSHVTPRERAILRLQAEGLGYKQIAARLNLSEHTVNNHLYSVRQKLGVHTAIEAINCLQREPKR
jgi:DNA-binding NarL/FixJ family response regulator